MWIDADWVRPLARPSGPNGQLNGFVRGAGNVISPPPTSLTWSSVFGQLAIWRHLALVHLVQIGLSQFCSVQKLWICNGRGIGDRLACTKADCPFVDLCAPLCCDDTAPVNVKSYSLPLTRCERLA